MIGRPRKIDEKMRDEIVQLVVSSDLTYDQIADKLGISYSSVSRIALEEDVNRGYGLSEEQKQIIIDTYKDNPDWSQRRVARELSFVKKTAVNNVIREFEERRGGVTEL